VTKRVKANHVEPRSLIVSQREHQAGNGPARPHRPIVRASPTYEIFLTHNVKNPI